MAATPSSPDSHPVRKLRLVLLSISLQAERDLALLPLGEMQRHIHALRVRMKKLKAVLRLIKPGLASTTIHAIRHHMRALKQAFATNRDQHVLRSLFDEIIESSGTSRRQCRSTVNGANSRRLPGRTKLHRLKATAHNLTRHLQNMTVAPLDWDFVIKAYACRYAKARQQYRRSKKKPSAALLHRWRSPVKEHYVQSLLLLRDRHHLRLSRKLGNLLGQMHDLALLREHCKQSASNDLARTIRRRMKSLRALIFRNARHLFELKPGKLARLAKAQL